MDFTPLEIIYSIAFGFMLFVTYVAYQNDKMLEGKK